ERMEVADKWRELKKAQAKCTEVAASNNPFVKDKWATKCSNAEKAFENARNKFIKKFGFDPSPDNTRPRDCFDFNITLSSHDSNTFAKIEFKTPRNQVPLNDQIYAQNLAFDMVMTKGRTSFNLLEPLMSIDVPVFRRGKLGENSERAELIIADIKCTNPDSTVTVDELLKSPQFVIRAEAALAMARHIWSVNPQAKIEPGSLTPEYKKQFEALRTKAEKGELFVNNRHAAGFPSNQRPIEKQKFDAGSPNPWPSTMLEGVSSTPTSSTASVGFLSAAGKGMEAGDLTDESVKSTAPRIK
ncbi:MAG: hypothetical protein ACK4PR_08975, partial [Gammaproteobacteria bacterium]